MTIVLAVVVGGLGALLRAEVTARRGVRQGTALVNLVGAFLLGLLVGLAGAHGVESSTLLVLGAGGLGGLTTFSTWVLDVTDRDPADQVPAMGITLGVGMLLAGLGWFLGALLG